MKQFATWFTHGVPGGAKLRKAIYEARTGPAVLGEVDRFFADRSHLHEEISAGDEEVVIPEQSLVCD